MLPETVKGTPRLRMGNYNISNIEAKHTILKVANQLSYRKPNRYNLISNFLNDNLDEYLGEDASSRERRSTLDMDTTM